MDSKDIRGLMEAYVEVYAPQEEIEEAEKWIQKAIKKPGALHKQLGVPEGEKIPAGKLAVAAKKGGKLGKRARLAQTLSGLHKEDIEIDEAVKGADPEMRKAAAAERRSGDKPLPAKEGEKYAEFKAAQVAYIKRRMKNEEIDLYDIVLEFLQKEGYANTLREAEWLMANKQDEVMNTYKSSI